MTADPTSLVLNLLAFAGAGAYVALQLGARERSPVETRLTALFALMTVLVGVRAVHWGFGLESFRRLEEAVAAFVPLMALIVAEGLMRRHAPAWAKPAVLIGALAFALGAFVRPPAIALQFAVGLGAFIGVSLAALALLLWTRPRRTLAAAENEAISALSVGLLLALPLVATDFLAAAGHSPIRGGALALLVFVFAVVRLSAGGGGPAALADFVWALIGSGVGLGALIATLGMPSEPDGVRWFAMIFAFILVSQIVQRLRAYRQAARQRSFGLALAEAPTANLEEFLSAVTAAPELDHAHILETDDLSDYDVPALTALFSEAPVISAADVKDLGGAYEQLAVLFDAHESTHATLLTKAPPRLMLVNLPRVSAGPDAVIHLALMAKLANQIGGARDRAA